MNLAPALRPLRCKNPDCSFPTGGRCARAAELGDPLVDCEDLARGAGETAPAVEAIAATPEPRPEAPRTPWTGRHLAPDEIARMGWQTHLHKVAVIGPRNSGKTCLLTSFFLQIANGQREPLPYRFAGSRTLYAFHELCERAESWSGSGEVVEHTKAEETDTPRTFLHFLLHPERHEDARVLNLILSDVPGEWVRDWALKQDEKANRQLGFVDQCGAIALLVDAAALHSQSGHRLDSESSTILRRIADRLHERRRHPPIALLFTKYDEVIHSHNLLPPEEGASLEQWRILDRRPRTKSAIEYAKELSFEVRIYAVSAFPKPMTEGQPVGVLRPFAWLMAKLDNRSAPRPTPAPVPEGASSFLAMRREIP